MEKDNTRNDTEVCNLINRMASSIGCEVVECDNVNQAIRHGFSFSKIIEVDFTDKEKNKLKQKCGI
jgi:hypothetical protein